MMHNLKSKLITYLKNAKRIAILGVGSRLCGDDSSGVAACAYIQKSLKNNQRKSKVFFGASAPENLTGEIKKFKPTHLVIMDAADLRARPGNAVLLKPEELGGVSFSSHRLPLQILADYLAKSLGCKIAVIGIQPKTLGFNQPRSPVMDGAIKLIGDTIVEIINQMTPT